MIDGYSKLIILGRDLSPLADLENAYDIVEDERINTISHIQFSLPYDDHKNQYCEAFNYIRNPGGELYRLMMDGKTISETGDWEYRGEHVFATLLDTLMIGEVVMGGTGVGTSGVIRQILSRQPVRNWVLDECDFDFQFEYGWADESLMAAILDVPHHFLDPFQWTFNTDRYPFVLNLKKLNPNAEPKLYIEQGKNRIKAVRRTDQTSVCTRLYPYGYGEGANRLTIERVNNGVPFVQSPPHIFNRYPNAIERTFVDRRFQNPQSLLEVAQSILEQAQTPFEEFEVELTQLSGDPFSIPALGKIADIVGFKKTYITGIRWEYKEVPKCTVTLANRTRDIANEVLQLRNRQRIESTYAQGVTQFWQTHDKGNATPQRAFELPLFIPGSMRIINFVTLDVRVEAFAVEVENRRTEQPNTDRTGLMIHDLNTSHVNLYNVAVTNNTLSQNTNANVTVTDLPNNAVTGGRTASVTVNNATGATGTGNANITSIFVPGYSGSDGSAVSGNLGASHNHGIPSGTRLLRYPSGWSGFTPSGAHSHPNRTVQSNDIRQNAHSHAMGHGHTASTANHDHQMGHRHSTGGGTHAHGMAHNHTIQNGFHSHAMTNHQHFFPHTHMLEPGIVTAENPTGFTIRINGTNRKTVDERNWQGDLKQWMGSSGGEVHRNFLHRIEIIPNAPAYVRITAFVQGFLMAERELVI